MLQIEYEPHGVIEQIGDALSFVTKRVEGDLERFKKFIESRGQETGSWRGSILRRRDPSRTHGFPEGLKSTRAEHRIPETNSAAVG